MARNFASFPKNIISPDGQDGRMILQQMGIIFREKLTEDLIRAELPDNLVVKRTNNPRVLVLYDSKHRGRAYIIIGNTAQEKSRTELVRRFCLTIDYGEKSNAPAVHALIFDGSKKIHSTDLIVLPVGKARRQMVVDECQDRALAWLYNHYPEWRSPAAYWD